MLNLLAPTIAELNQLWVECFDRLPFETKVVKLCPSEISPEEACDHLLNGKFLKNVVGIDGEFYGHKSTTPFKDWGEAYQPFLFDINASGNNKVASQFLRFFQITNMDGFDPSLAILPACLKHLLTSPEVRRIGFNWYTDCDATNNTYCQLLEEKVHRYRSIIGDGQKIWQEIDIYQVRARHHCEKHRASGPCICGLHNLPNYDFRSSSKLSELQNTLFGVKKEDSWKPQHHYWYKTTKALARMYGYNKIRDWPAWEHMAKDPMGHIDVFLFFELYHDSVEIFRQYLEANHRLSRSKKTGLPRYHFPLPESVGLWRQMLENNEISSWAFPEEYVVDVKSTAQNDNDDVSELAEEPEIELVPSAQEIAQMEALVHGNKEGLFDLPVETFSVENGEETVENMELGQPGEYLDDPTVRQWLPHLPAASRMRLSKHVDRAHKRVGREHGDGSGCWTEDEITAECFAYAKSFGINHQPQLAVEDVHMICAEMQRRIQQNVNRHLNYDPDWKKRKNQRKKQTPSRQRYETKYWGEVARQGRPLPSFALASLRRQNSGLEEDREKTSEITCNNTVTLTSTLWHATLYSPNYPKTYDDFLDCYIVVTVPEKSWLIVEFTKFILETEIHCEYDYLEIWEEGFVNDTWLQLTATTRLCGDWSYKLKLLRRIVTNPQLLMHFHSDHSRGYGGYYANVYLEDSTHRRSINVCNNKKLRNYGNNCYLFINFPTVDWNTASQVCKSSGGHLASIINDAEEHFLVEQVLRSHEYTSDDFFWLGGNMDKEKSTWLWEDKNDFNYTDWFGGIHGNSSGDKGDDKVQEECLALQQQFQTSDLKANSFFIADRLYWSGRDCKNFGGYICKMDKPVVSEGENINVTLEGELFGTLTLPGYPADYPNNFDYTVYIIAQPKTRILIRFLIIDTEYQERCLYDYIRLKTFDHDPSQMHCGHIEENPPDFASYANQAILQFHSDYSITATGFKAEWQVVNISNCKVDTEEPQGYINSVNFPHFYLNALQCETTIRTADANGRILLDFVYFDVGQLTLGCLNTDYVLLYLDGDLDRRTVRLCGKLNTANESRNILFVSFSNFVKIVFNSDDRIWGVGYRAFYKTLNDKTFIQQLKLKPNETSELKSVNYPRTYPPDLCMEIVFRADYGYQILLNFDELYLTPETLQSENVIQLINPAAIQPQDNNASTTAVALYNFGGNFTHLSIWNRITVKYCGYDDRKSAIVRRFRSTVSTVIDPIFWTAKALKNNTGIIENCEPNPCHHGFPCLENDEGHYCDCSPSFLGTFCHFSVCHFSPCQHGKCEITNKEHETFYCICEPEYTGKKCEFQIRPCASAPCQNNGECLEELGKFTCMCPEGYKGDFCEKKILFEAKTLRESFLRDPFWLGLFMILGVMGTVGIVNCCRKKCADTKLSLICSSKPSSTPKHTDRIYNYDDEKELLRKNSQDERGDDDSEVCFSFADLGIDTSQFNSLLQLGDVNFKMKLSELTEEQANTLETYLENYLRIHEQTNNNNNRDSGNVKSLQKFHEYNRKSLRSQSYGDRSPETGRLVDIDDPNYSPEKSSDRAGEDELGNYSGESTATVKSSETLNQALDSITDLILKSAEIVRHNAAGPSSMNSAQMSPKQRNSVSEEISQKHHGKHQSVICQNESEESEDKYDTKQGRQRFRGVSKALMMVKRPQSVEISRDNQEEMKRLCYRGASSLSIGGRSGGLGKSTAFDEETFA